MFGCPEETAKPFDATGTALGGMTRDAVESMLAAAGSVTATVSIGTI